MSGGPAGPRPGALAGLRVVEVGRGISAPWCARILAALGADVVKVEPPDGDPARRWGAAEGAPGESALFAWLNAGKRSIRLTGAAGDDTALVQRLAAGADAVVTNLPPCERTAWGLAETSLDATGAGAVVLALSPYGDSGPWAHAAGESLTVCAVGGMSIILGEPGRTPLSFPFDLPAMQAGLHGAAAVLTALLARRHTGRGQRVEVAEADVMAFLAGGMSLFILGGGGKWERRGFERHGGIYPSGFYPCKDGFVFLATQSRAPWTAFLRLMGDPEWATRDPELRDGVAIGWRRADEVDLRFIPWLANHTRAELTALAAREPDIVLGPINDVPDVLAAPHLEARGFWDDVAVGGRSIRMPGLGFTMSATPWRSGSAPRLGDVAPAEAWQAPRIAAPPPARSIRPPRPLAGYRAIEFGWNWAGPLVGQMLADFGMEVIKVETADRLDFMRHWPHARAFFHNANRGKLSVSVNVKRPEGRDLVRRLARTADVVWDNFSAGVMARNGLGYEALREAKSDLIVLSMAMAGQTGPLRHLRGFATMATGFAGVEAAIGYPHSGPTGLPAIGIGDANAAIQGVVAVLAALWHRERTGEGQFIDLSQIEAATTLDGGADRGVSAQRPGAGPAGQRPRPAGAARHLPRAWRRAVDRPRDHQRRGVERPRAADGGARLGARRIARRRRRAQAAPRRDRRGAGRLDGDHGARRSGRAPPRRGVGRSASPRDRRDEHLAALRRPRRVAGGRDLRGREWARLRHAVAPGRHAGRRRSAIAPVRGARRVRVRLAARTLRCRARRARQQQGDRMTRAAFPPVDAADRARWTGAGLWLDRTLHDYFDETVARVPDRVAIVAGDRRITFAQWADEAARAAAGLVRLGIRPGDVVTVQLPNWPEMCVLQVALSRIGAVIQPMHMVYRQREMASMLRFCDSRAVVLATTYQGFDHAAALADIRNGLPDLAIAVTVGGRRSDTVA